MPTQSRSVGVLVLVVAALAVASSHWLSAGTVFTFPEVSDEPVLVLGEMGGTLPSQVLLKAYASGSAELEFRWNGNIVQREAVDGFEPSEMEEFLQLIVGGRLHEYDELSVRSRASRAANLVPAEMLPPLDSATFVVEFSLEVVSEGDPMPTLVHKKLTIRAPDFFAERFPDAREYVALDSLKRRFDAERTARSKAR